MELERKFSRINQNNASPLEVLIFLNLNILMKLAKDKVFHCNLTEIKNNQFSYFYIERCTFKVMYQGFYRAKRDKKETA